MLPSAGQPGGVRAEGHTLQDLAAEMQVSAWHTSGGQVCCWCHTASHWTPVALVSLGVALEGLESRAIPSTSSDSLSVSFVSTTKLAYLLRPYCTEVLALTINCLCQS